MSTREIDQLMALLMERKRQGYFAGFWRTAAESVVMMASGRSAAQSIWSPAITALAGAGVDVVEVAPREGYRAWHGGLCLARHLKGRQRDVAYAYLNWWLSGWPGLRRVVVIFLRFLVKPYVKPEKWYGRPEKKQCKLLV